MLRTRRLAGPVHQSLFITGSLVGGLWMRPDHRTLYLLGSCFWQDLGMIYNAIILLPLWEALVFPAWIGETMEELFYQGLLGGRIKEHEWNLRG
jgi:hypothetical protein